MSSAPFPHPMVTLGRQIRHDPHLGHTFVPRVHRRVPHEHGAYFAATNAEGFREDHDLSQPPGDGFRVLCFGDSYAAGDGVDNGDRFTAMLAAQLGITVSNVAVPGHGPDQNVLQLEHTPLPRPDLILWCIAVHTIDRIQSRKDIRMDHRGGLWHMDRPHFVLDAAGALELRGVPAPERGEELIESPPLQVQHPLAAITADVARRLRSRLGATLRRCIGSAPDPDYTDAASSGWRLMAALVRRFHRAAGDSPVAIVPLPTSRYLAENNTAHFQARFAELADPTAGLHVLDVVTRMRRMPRRDRIRFNYRLDGHYTAAGHAAVAAALTEQLRERGLVPEVAPTSNAAAQPNRPVPEGTTLHVGWSLDDAFARLCTADGRTVAEHREATITEHPCRPGVLPVSAIHACLDAGRVAGPELNTVVLHSPCTLEDLADTHDADPRRFCLLSGWVRWHGAAAIDLRRLLDYAGPIDQTVDATIPNTGGPDRTPATAADEDDDDELRWLRKRIGRLRTDRGAAALRHQLRRLAHRWERVTRAARETVLPTSAPLRRGRVAQQLARAQ